MTSLTEENYLKAIYKLQEKDDIVTTSALAENLQVHAASVTEFIKKMASKKLISYQKSKGVKLLDKGKTIAVNIIRKHRLWELWLVDQLGFKWDEVHDIAEQLEHVVSDELVEKLNTYLGYPKSDPHGDPIPDAKGKFPKHTNKPLLHCKKGDVVKFIGVAEHSSAFLQYLGKIHLKLGDEIRIESIEEYDQSFHIKTNNKEKKVLSREVSKNLLVI